MFQHIILKFNHILRINTYFLLANYFFGQMISFCNKKFQKNYYHILS